MRKNLRVRKKKKILRGGGGGPKGILRGGSYTLARTSRTSTTVSDTDMSGGYQANPFHFQNFGANYLCIQANGEQIPRLAYQLNFTDPD